MKKVLLTYRYGIAILYFVIIGLTSSYAQFSVNIESIKQVSYVNPFQRPLSSDLEFNIQYSNPPGGVPKFLNLVLEDPISMSQQYWVIENLMLDTFPTLRTLTYTVKMGPLGIPDGTNLSLYQMYTTYLISDTVLPFVDLPLPPSSFQLNTIGTAIWNYGPGSIALDTIPLQMSVPIPPNDWTETDSTRKVTRGCNMHNYDLDSTTHNGTTAPGYANDWNACVPTSCANSMQWLEDRHPSELVTGLTLKQKVEEMSKAMKRQYDKGVMTDTMIRGKMEYIEKYKLPIHVKFQDVFDTNACHKSFTNGYNHCAENKGKNLGSVDSLHLDFDWLYSEMKKGEDVEMLVQWVSAGPGGTVIRQGHAVVLSGVEDIKGVKRIIVKDDSLQGAAGGMRERPLTMGTSASPRFPIVNEWSTPTQKCYITGWVSESYDSTVTYAAAGVNDLQHDPYVFSVWPNPAEGNANLQLEVITDQSCQAEFSLSDHTGKCLQTWKEMLNPGRNLFVHSIQPSSHALSTGLYIITLNMNGYPISRRLVIR
ncbi:MAG: T9SS type A sorting domain-containing protein [Chitinophagaceae bacterium]|nr:T9SS type A sorting domain-containing protein [Chitinophagaceae bacterium]